MEYNEIKKTNKVLLKGKIIDTLEIAYECFGENFLKTKLSCKRSSGTEDILPVIFPERIGNIENIQPGTCIEINGEIRTCNKHESDRNKLLINVYCNEFNIIQEEEFYPSDEIELNGYICKEPVYRKTPLGREIADLLLAVNRKFGKSDYIPCITWSRNARFVNELPVGSNIQVSGRLQSRKYIKRTEAGTEVTKTAYEVSINRIRLIEKASPKESLETPDESCEIQSTPA